VQEESAEGDLLDERRDEHGRERDTEERQASLRDRGIGHADDEHRAEDDDRHDAHRDITPPPNPTARRQPRAVTITSHMAASTNEGTSVWRVTPSIDGRSKRRT
jgi:hypothetical protein